MAQYIDKSALVAEIENLEKVLESTCEPNPFGNLEECLTAAELQVLDVVKETINALEVKDPYEQCVQYDSIKAGIQAHAETYSFNIESELFQQLTKEQQKLWRKEIEQAIISGGEIGVELARDIRYKESLEVKEVDLEKEINEWQGCEVFPEGVDITPLPKAMEIIERTAKHFFELGLMASNKSVCTVPKLDELLKEEGIEPDSKEAKMFKQAYYKAIDLYLTKAQEL